MCVCTAHVCVCVLYVCVCMCALYMCVCAGPYLLHVLLEDAELQALVQAHLALLPDVLQLPLVVQHLVDDVQHVVIRLGVVSRGRQGVSAAWGQGPLQLVQQGLTILAHLRRGEEGRGGERLEVRGEERMLLLLKNHV